MPDAVSPGDLQLRLRRCGQDDGAGWEVLLRLSPRPLSARSWRVCDMPGALNAGVAYAMAMLSQPRPDHVVLNVACGSGTLLVERLACAPASRAIGCDVDAAALRWAAQNVRAAGYDGVVELHRWDARALPLPDASVDAVLADLPFGHRVGSHGDNCTLYPAILEEAARVARTGARFVLLTPEVRRMGAVLRNVPQWKLEEALPVSLRRTQARVFVLRRVWSPR
jgi:23S rRNA G2445 N2-methylase RlmL